MFPIVSFKKEWKYHLLINHAWFYCSRLLVFIADLIWVSPGCLNLLEHGGVHWLEALLLSTPHTDTQHETWTIPLLIHSLCYSYVLNLSMYLQWKLCLSVLYGVLWTLIIKWINFQLLDVTFTDRTEITEKKLCSVSQHLLQFLGDKIAKKNREDPGKSSVDIDRKLITDDPENCIRNWFSADS